MKNIALILNYNNADEVITLVNTIGRYADLDQIVIVDNASTDNSAFKMQNEFSESNNIIILRSPVNGGYSQGNNEGLRYIWEDYKDEDAVVFIINPDVYVSNFGIKRLSEYVRTIDNVGLVSGLLTKKRDIENPNAWRLLNPLHTAFIQSNIFQKMFRSVYRKQYYYSLDDVPSTKIVPVDVILGAFFAIKLSTFEKLGFFDDDTFLYSEEDILALRIQKLGLQSYIVPEVSFEHIGGSSTGNSLSNFKVKQLKYKSFIIFAKKYKKEKWTSIIAIRLIWCANLAYTWLGIKMRGVK
ncbi:glycosyltransferase family 2 protein [Weissella confusa]|uniref:glycosyltransferase family 2 protein n=1 Tax=Weissella confusa TaxID=1583 RepID=UPI002A764AC1|nr:glycosyltransferase family 2 protein [Weissella confusa]MDY2513074.1 glycosyltransferase family 2 protein [Weissella confusa]